MKYTISIGLICLIVISVFFSVSADTNEKAQSQLKDSNNGVTFTIDNYEKKGNNLKINYTVTSKSKLEGHKAKQPFLDRPSFYVNQEFLNTSYSEEIKKVNSHKYTGYINIDDIKKDHFNLKIKINRISNQVGNWDVSFDY